MKDGRPEFDVEVISDLTREDDVRKAKTLGAWYLLEKGRLGIEDLGSLPEKEPDVHG